MKTETELSADEKLRLLAVKYAELETKVERLDQLVHLLRTDGVPRYAMETYSGDEF